MKKITLMLLVFMIVSIIFSVNSWAQMTFGSNGEIGIGTDTPISDLEIGARDPVFVASLTDAVNFSYPKDLCVSGNYAYVLGSKLHIVDITDSVNPEVLGSSAALSSPKSIAVSGSYAYVVDFVDQKLKVFDISDPSNPTLLPNILSHASLEGCQSIYVSGKFAYVVSNSLDNLNIIDISDPYYPLITDTYVSAVNIGSPSSVYVAGNFAYVASSDNGGKLTTIDISDPSAPVFKGSVAVNSPKSVSVLGRYAYVVSYLGDFIATIDVSDPSSPEVVGTLVDHGRMEQPLRVQVAGDFAYVTANNYFTVVDISDPEHPALAGYVSNSETFDDAEEMPLALSGRYAYIVSKDNDNLSIYDIAGFESPAANIGSVQASRLDVTANAIVNHNLDVGTSLNVGSGGIKSDGPVSIRDVLTLTPRATSPEKIPGAIYFDSGDQHLYIYNGSDWKQLRFSDD